ncbi:MAG: hypothetical protein GX148_04295 [Clostridiales bacterium]|jgi:predicted metal-dependent phosphotriesterase family hydrolase|nr:hypothetical protein [Clostridiales bacterium]
MKRVFHWIKIIFKLIFLLLVVILLTPWGYIKYLICRNSFKKRLKRHGIPKDQVKDLSKELNPFRLFKYSA